MRIIRTLTTAIAVAALTAPAAQARPAGQAQRDMHASVAIAASQQAQQRPPGHAGQRGGWNAAPATAPQQVDNAPAVVGGDDDGTSWSTIGLIAGGLLALGAVAAIGVRRSPRVRANV